MSARGLDRVRWGRLTAHTDERGSFREVWRRSTYPSLDEVVTGRPEATFVQANISSSAAGVLRGMHYHRRQLDHWVVLSGRAFVALVDVHAVAADLGQAAIETRELASDETVSIPVGIAHGFLALEPVRLMYFVTNEYDGTDELGFAWDDPAVGIRWPDLDGKRPILSERDTANPTLRQLLVTLEG